MKKFLLIFLCIPFIGFSHPFDYDLHFSSSEAHERVMICAHGYGGSYRITERLKALCPQETTLISFNFPDHDLRQKNHYNPEMASFGTLRELLPLLYVIHKTISEQNLNAIDLYGFSAGGAAVVNALAILNSNQYEAELESIGIRAEEKRRLLSVIEQGIVILDTPLKSVEEIIDFLGPSKELDALAKNYREHHLRPLNSLQKLQGLCFTVLLHFQKCDEVLSNRDDQLYIRELKAALGEKSVHVIIANEGGHSAPHFSLWKAYTQMIRD